MTKLLILSDSHGMLNYMRDAVRRYRPQAVFHLGDHCADADALSREIGIPLISVRGNCDYYARERAEQWECEFDGVRILAVHGHQYGVKMGLLRLRYAALERDAQLVLFGHTHQPCCQQEGDLWMVNPGACGGYRPTCALIETENGSLNCRIIDLYSEENV